MMLTKSALGALVGVALFAAPAFADPAEDAKKAVEKLDQLSKDLQALKDSLKIDALRESAKTIDSKIELLDKDIQDIKKDLKELRRRAGDGSSTSLRPEFDSAPPRTLGRVRIINTHPFEMSVVLNGLSYRLASGEERLFRVTPGEYRFEVLQIPGVRKVGEIAAGETKTFTIYPIQ
jgi:hypothetical protein